MATGLLGMPSVLQAASVYRFFFSQNGWLNENAARNTKSHISFTLDDAIDAALRWSLPVRLEERDDGRVVLAFCD